MHAPPRQGPPGRGGRRGSARAAPAWATVLFCAAVLAGCARGPGAGGVPPASAGIEDFIAALRGDDPAPAYALLAEDVRARIGFEEFAAKWRATAPERQARARRIAAELRARPELGERARVVIEGGGAAFLVREGDAWRLESTLLSSSHAGQPRDAVTYLAQALAEHDYEAVLRILTERRRAVLSRVVADLVASLSRHLDSGVDTIERLGEDRAAMRWDDGETRYELILHREGDEWRVDDIHIRLAPDEAASD